MNLKELLLQLAGESSENLKLDELLTNKVKGIEVDEELDGGLRLLVKKPSDLEEIKESIQNTLEKNGYDQYTIEPEREGQIWHILVKVE